MRGPKQRWTAEEEAALKAGIRKHGTGKWRAILMDPDFGPVLRIRSNVDLKDKWRNIKVMAIWGSRHKAKLALNTTPHNPELEQSLKDLLPKLDSLIVEAISTLKEPEGSDEASIATYIEDKQCGVPNLRKLLARKLKLLIATGKLIKVKQQYRIAPSSTVSKGTNESPLLVVDGKQKNTSNVDKNSSKIQSMSHVEQELHRIQGMTAEEAAAVAVKAIAEAEFAIAEAEEAARKAERAEAEAEACHVFAEAAVQAFRYQTCHYWSFL